MSNETRTFDSLILRVERYASGRGGSASLRRDGANEVIASSSGPDVEQIQSGIVDALMYQHSQSRDEFKSFYFGRYVVKAVKFIESELS